MGQILTFTTTKVKPHWICAKTHKLPTWLNNLRGILQGNPAFSMSLSFSFAHHKSIYQCFFHFISIAFLFSSPYLLPHLHSFLLCLLSHFSLLSLSFPLPSYNPTFFSPFCASPSDLISSPPSPPPSFLPSLLLQSLPLQLPAYPSTIMLSWIIPYSLYKVWTTHGA